MPSHTVPDDHFRYDPGDHSLITVALNAAASRGFRSPTLVLQRRSRNPPPIRGRTRPSGSRRGRRPIVETDAARRESLHVVRDPNDLAWLGEATGLGPGSIPSEGFSSVSVALAAGTEPDSALAAVQDLGFQAATAAQIGGEVPEGLQSFVALSTAVRYAGIAIGLVVTFVFVRTMLLSRLPEVGLLKSFGYSTPQILAILAGELLLVTAVASVLGLAGGAAATPSSTRSAMAACHRDRPSPSQFRRST